MLQGGSAYAGHGDDDKSAHTNGTGLGGGGGNYASKVRHVTTLYCSVLRCAMLKRQMFTATSLHVEFWACCFLLDPCFTPDVNFRPQKHCSKCLLVLHHRNLYLNNISSTATDACLSLCRARWRAYGLKSQLSGRTKTSRFLTLALARPSVGLVCMKTCITVPKSSSFVCRRH